MALYTFTPNTVIESSKIDDNFAGLASGAEISAGAILPNHLKSGASTLNTWVWDSWTPTLSNITLGNGTATYKYIRVGNLIMFRFNITLGSTSSLGTETDAFITLPVSANSGYALGSASDYVPIGFAHYIDASSAFYMGTVAIPNDVTKIALQVGITDSTYLSPNNVDNNEPMTWATGDKIWGTGFYEA